MKSLLLHTNDALYRACVWVAGLSLTIVAIIIPWGVFARYALGTGSRWPEPIAVLLMVIFTFLGAAAAYRANAHMAVALLTSRLSPARSHALELLVQGLMAITALFMMIWGINLCVATWGQFNAALPGLRVGMAYLPIPVGAALTLSFVIERILCGEQSGRAAVQLDGHASEGAD